jgi:hypothetical protein
MTVMSNEHFDLPVLLSFSGKPGRGEAGWTVYRFTSRASRLTFMAAHAASRMPCWARIERGEA